MVALTIGLLILAGASTLFINSKKNYVVQDSLARMQENARFAMQRLIQDVRMAGYYGCADDVSSVTNTLKNASTTSAYDAAASLQGSEGKSKWYPGGTVDPPANMRAGTDAVAIRYLDTTTETAITAPFMPNTSAALHTTAGNGLKKGDVVVLSDCSGAAVFQITGPDDPNGGTIVHNTGEQVPGNETKDLGKIFEDDAQIGKYYYAMYYIAPGASGEFALFRQTVTPTGLRDDELVEGIEDMQVLYGEDTASGDRIPDLYRKADAVANWNNVVAIRIGLLARTLASSGRSGKDYGAFKDTTDGYDVDGDGAKETNYASAPNDMYQRRVFRSDVTLRNLQ